MPSEERFSSAIAQLATLIIMSATVELDSQLHDGAIEIQKVPMKRMLSAEFVISKIPVPQVSPKNAFRFSRLLSQQWSAMHNGSF